MCRAPPWLELFWKCGPPQGGPVLVKMTTAFNTYMRGTIRAHGGASDPWKEHVLPFPPLIRSGEREAALHHFPSFFFLVLFAK